MDNKIYLALFTNTKKQPGSNQPDFNGKGTMTVDQLTALLIAAKAAGGELKIELAGWHKIGKGSGVKYVSLNMKPQQQAGSVVQSSDDDIPF